MQNQLARIKLRVIRAIERQKNCWLEEVTFIFEVINMSAEHHRQLFHY
jgi:hypothetical protein